MVDFFRNLMFLKKKNSKKIQPYVLENFPQETFHTRPRHANPTGQEDRVEIEDIEDIETGL